MTPEQVADALAEVLDDMSGLYPAGLQIIAAALAEEREKARAPFLALADRWSRMADETPNPWDRVTIRSHADHLRRVAEEG